MPAKPIPLTIHSCGDDDHDCLMSKGHHDDKPFLAAAAKHWGEKLPSGFEAPKREWWRTMPDRSGEYASRFVPAVAGSRGAFPVTYVKRY